MSGSWTVPVSTTLSAIKLPSACSDGQNRIYIVATNHDNHVKICSFNASENSVEIMMPVYNNGQELESDHGASIAFWNGNPYLCWKDASSSQIYLGKLAVNDRDTNGTWPLSQVGELHDAQTSFSPAMACNGSGLLVVFRSKDKRPEIYYSASPSWNSGKTRWDPAHHASAKVGHDDQKTQADMGIAAVGDNYNIAYLAVSLVNPRLDLIHPLYLGTYDTSSDNWSSANRIQTGNLKIKGVPANRIIDITSEHSPGLAYNSGNSTLYLAHTAFDSIPPGLNPVTAPGMPAQVSRDELQYASLAPGDNNWNELGNIKDTNNNDMVTDIGPALVVHNGVLHMAYPNKNDKGNGGEYTVYISNVLGS